MVERNDFFDGPSSGRAIPTDRPAKWDHGAGVDIPRQPQGTPRSTLLDNGSVISAAPSPAARVWTSRAERRARVQQRGAHILKGVPGEWRLFAVA